MARVEVRRTIREKVLYGWTLDFRPCRQYPRGRQRSTETTYLITGGADFIASHVTEALLGGGDPEIVLDKGPNGRSKGLVRKPEGRFSTVEADKNVLSRKELKPLAESSRRAEELATMAVPAAGPSDRATFHAVDFDRPLRLEAAPKVFDGAHVRTTYERFMKRPLDIVLAVFLVLSLLPILLGLALTIRVSLGSGVIYRQERVGWGGRRFTMIKFRTMLPDRRVAQLPFAGPDRRICHKRDDDPRHTKVGRWFRKTSLDELPQLWNVIKGDMSLVGPRPELPSVVERYEPWQHARHQIRPGLTGFWQISDRAGGLANEGVHLDLDYMQKLSLATDCTILLRTVLVVIRSTGH